MSMASRGQRKGPLVFAHRGVSSEFPENSIEAFGAARFRGADGVELDARSMGDGGVAVHHDARLADGTAIITLDRAQLPGTVPSLAEALEACEGLIVNIELKNMPGEPDFDPANAVADRVVNIVKKLGFESNVLVSSFNLSSINRVRTLEPLIQTAWLLFDIGTIDEQITQACERGHVAINPPASRTNASMIAAAHAQGLRVNVWTVDDPVRMEELIVDGVDGLITNVPDVARRTVTAHFE